MRENDFTPLIDYVKAWKEIDGIKPCNEPKFIIYFVKLLENYPDDREVTFDGEGSYFGKQVTLEPFSFYGRPPRELCFEVAYDKENIRVYTAHHNGYWQPEFISLNIKDVDFPDLIDVWFKFLHKVFGL